MASNDRKKEQPKKSLLARKRLQAETQEPRPMWQPDPSATADVLESLFGSPPRSQGQEAKAEDSPETGMSKQEFEDQLAFRKRLVESWGGTWKG